MKTGDVSHVATAYYVSELIQFTANRLLVSFSSFVVQKIWMTTIKALSFSNFESVALCRNLEYLIQRAPDSWDLIISRSRYTDTSPAFTTFALIAEHLPKELIA